MPLLRQVQGFRSYYLLDGDPDVLITIGVSYSADEALGSNEQAADWVSHNVLEFTKGMPEVMVGNALMAEVKSESSVVQVIRGRRWDWRDPRTAPWWRFLLGEHAVHATVSGRLGE